MKRSLTVLFALMLVLSGCLGGDDVIDNEEPVEPLLDTDGDGTPDVDDDDDDNDSWTDLDELNCDSDSLLASSMPADADGDGICDLSDSDKDGDGWSNIDEEACGSDPVVATDIPADADEDGTCDAFDDDADDDSFVDGVENQCGSDPLDATSIPADMDGDGTCDALDDDKDGDGVANDDDFAPEDPDKSEGEGGCMDASAFNYDETAEVDDATCFTLRDAEEALATAHAGVMFSQAMEYLEEDMYLQEILVQDLLNGTSALSVAILDDEGEILDSASYIDDGNGFVEVELSYTSEEGGSPLVERFKVNDDYHDLGVYFGEPDGYSHCEYDGVEWYCAFFYSPVDGIPQYNPNSETQTYHLYTCANGDTVLLSQVNDGTDDCADASDEPDIQADGSMFMCDDGSTIDFYLANDGDADCADGSDEDNFIAGFFCADGSNSFQSEYVNNGYDDCDDGSDEPVYDLSAYETSVYTCEDGSDVHLSNVNDGTDDCADGTDERPTGPFKEYYFFQCVGDFEENIRLPLSLVNDGKEDCPDGSDEPTYDEFGEETSEYECWDMENGTVHIILLSEVNDGVIDCDLREDEGGLAGNRTTVQFGPCTVGMEQYVDFPFSWVNDGIDDCDDGTDEPAFDENGNEVSTMMCDDGTEIPLSWANDGEEDCAGGEDEAAYAMVVNVDCGDGDTIPFSYINDGEEDCMDGSDEPTYEFEELTNFECDDGEIIPFSYVNNRNDDCSDGEDEPVITSGMSTSFECVSGDWLHFWAVNDGNEDCPDGDDEPSFDPITQNEVSTFTCPMSNETIPLSSVNDDSQDCEDLRDEWEGNHLELTAMECADGTEIPLSWANDGEDDCSDGSDEAEIVMTDLSVFFCADGAEITVSQFNDGAIDCADGSDELATFLCDDGSFEISFNHVNDGYNDCGDESDESMAEDTNVVDCYDSEETLTVSQFRDGQHDCLGSMDMFPAWDEMRFSVNYDCEWRGNDWGCADVLFPRGESYEMLMHTDETGREMIVINVTSSNNANGMPPTWSATYMFDAATHAFLMMEETYDEFHLMVKSSAYDPTLVNALTMVDTSLDTHAPPFAVVFDGEPLAVDDGKVFVCDDGEEVPFAYANDGEEDCADGSDEPTYEEEVYTCSDDGSEIPMSWVNDGEDDCADGSDEPSYDSNGDETSIFTCLYSGEEYPLSWVNDNIIDCEDETDEEEGYSYMIGGFVCDDGDEIDFAAVNDGFQDCTDGSDELTVGEGHGYGEYAFLSTGLPVWHWGEEEVLDVVFSMCDTFTPSFIEESGDSYLLPFNCGEELARYTMDEIDNGDITGLMLGYDFDGNPMLLVDEDFELDGWNTVRLSTPSGEYADENPQVQLPAPGIGFALVAMLGAAMLAGRRDE